MRELTRGHVEQRALDERAEEEDPSTLALERDRTIDRESRV
ncbi:MAG TPA: hypothetical protein VGH98_05920 [Gemmatimonadaceae bacterium]